MFDSQEDQWPWDYSTGPTKHLHALGVISLNFNLFEAAWALVLQHYVGKETAEFLFEGKNTDAWRTAVVQHYVKLKEKEETVAARVDHAATFYAICAENRHTLMHSRQDFTNFVGYVRDHLPLEKRSKAGRIMRFNFDLPTLRRVADEMMTGVYFLTDTLFYVEDRGAAQLPRLEGYPTSLPRELPKIPRLPDKLTEAQILEAPEASRPPHVSSGE